MSRRSSLYQLHQSDQLKPDQLKPDQSCYQQNQLHQWQDQIQRFLPALSLTQARTLALWSIGTVLGGTCSLTTVAFALAQWSRQRPNTLRQRLREFYLDAPAKCGDNRRELDPGVCFAGLLAWVAARWRGTRIALALDATHFSDRFIVLCVSVLYRGAAIPVAWTILPADQPDPWTAHWQRMLTALANSLPPHWQVLVLADRGLFQRSLFTTICKLGWHPLLRVQKNRLFCPHGGPWQTMTSLVPEGGRVFRAKGVAFRTAPLPCTLLAYRAPGCTEECLLLTDLPADALDPACGQARWYCLRAWIECQFKLLKTAGLQWQRTRMTHPRRAERLWLILAVSLLWTMQTGTAAEERDDEHALWVPLVRASRTKLRLLCLWRRGQSCLLHALYGRRRLPTGCLVPEPWPQDPHLQTETRKTYPC